MRTASWLKSDDSNDTPRCQYFQVWVNIEKWKSFWQLTQKNVRDIEDQGKFQIPNGLFSWIYNKLSYSFLGLYDLNDLVEYGKKEEMCPYWTSR